MGVNCTMKKKRALLELATLIYSLFSHWFSSRSAIRFVSHVVYFVSVRCAMVVGGKKLLHHTNLISYIIMTMASFYLDYFLFVGILYVNRAYNILYQAR